MWKRNSFIWLGISNSSLLWTLQWSGHFVKVATPLQYYHLLAADSLLGNHWYVKYRFAGILGVLQRNVYFDPFKLLKIIIFTLIKFWEYWKDDRNVDFTGILPNVLHIKVPNIQNRSQMQLPSSRHTNFFYSGNEISSFSHNLNLSHKPHGITIHNIALLIFCLANFMPFFTPY
jgi:hypothetical protein